ncbi:MAG: hypothetical protein ACXVNQ_09900, partial [Bacteroidia bacterium]
QPWQGCALPTELFPHFTARSLSLGRLVFPFGIANVTVFSVLQKFSCKKLASYQFFDLVQL